MNDIGHMFGKPETTLRMSKEYEDGPISQLNIPKRAAKSRMKAGIEKISATALSAITNAGPKNKKYWPSVGITNYSGSN